DGQRVCGAGFGDFAGLSWNTEPLGDVAIGRRLPSPDFPDSVPDTTLEVRAAHVERKTALALRVVDQIAQSVKRLVHENRILDNLRARQPITKIVDGRAAGKAELHHDNPALGGRGHKIAQGALAPGIANGLGHVPSPSRSIASQGRW